MAREGTDRKDVEGRSMVQELIGSYVKQTRAGRIWSVKAGCGCSFHAKRRLGAVQEASIVAAADGCPGVGWCLAHCMPLRAKCSPMQSVTQSCLCCCAPQLLLLLLSLSPAAP